MNEELHSGEWIEDPNIVAEGDDCNDEDDPCQSDLEAVS